METFMLTYKDIKRGIGERNRKCQTFGYSWLAK
jgi:hypothetical protein